MRWNGRWIAIVGLALVGLTGSIVLQRQKTNPPGSTEVAASVAPPEHSAAPDFSVVQQAIPLVSQSQEDIPSQEAVIKPQLSVAATTANLFAASAPSANALESTKSLPSGFPKSLRSRVVKLIPEVVSRAGVSEGHLLTLELFSDAVYTARVDRVTEDKNGTVTIRGRIKEYPLGTVILTTSGGRTLGVIDIPEMRKKFLIQNEAGNATYYLLDTDLDNAGTLEGGPSLIPPSTRTGRDALQGAPAQDAPFQYDAPQAAATTSATVDVMIVYTPAARIWADASGGGIANVIAQAVAKGQLALDNSDTSLDLNLVHSAEISYTETDSEADLDHLTNPSDGYMDAVHNWREQYQADVVALLANIEFTGGLSWVLNSAAGDPEYAFCLNRVKQAASSFTVVHEIGHLMGCGHAKAQNVQPGPGLFSFSAGWRWTGSDNGKYCSVMTYEAGTYFADGITHTRVAYFSNPTIQHLGAATGNAVDAGNALTIHEIAPVVAGYRSGLSSGLPYTFTTNSGAITITEYIGSGGAVSIPNTINGLPVTSIGDQTFYMCTVLTGVAIPSSVTDIGVKAFYMCNNLTNVTIGSSVASIGERAFYMCPGLTSVTIPNSVTNIGARAFYSCTGLTNVTMGSSVATIGERAFYCCTGLTGITIPNKVTSIGDYAFYSCTSLISATIGASVTNIGTYAFNSCTSLTGVYFQGNAPSLGLNVFSGSNNATIYYLPGTTGWGPTFDGRPTVLLISDYLLTINGGTGGGSYTNQQRVIITANAPTVGKTFDRWSGATQYVASATSSTTTVTMPAQAVTLTATYKDIYCTLTATSSYGGSVPAGTNTYLFNTTVLVVVTNSPLQSGTTQYVCSGWTGTGSAPASGTTMNTGYFNITSDSTLVWLWATNYWLDAGVNNNGIVNVPDSWWPKGSNVQITATASEHYHFATWSGQTNGCTFTSNVITAPMTMPRAITANFVIDQHSLIVTTPYGKASPSAGTNWANWNSPVTVVLTNSPVVSGTTQYVCTGWTGSGSVPPSGTGTNTGLFTLTNNSSVSWQWATNYWLDTVTNGNGTVNQMDQWCRVGSNVVITATPSVSNRFTGWSGQTNGCTVNSNQITVSMTTPRQITANFIRQYGLAVSTPYGAGSLPDGTNLFDSGASVTVRMTNSPVTVGTTQYVCRGWVGTGNVPASGTATNAGPFTITGDSTITWLWRTNFWMDVGFTGSGTLSTGDCWLASGTNLQITATPSNHWHFGLWSGDTNGCTITSNKITVAMDRSRTIVAGFDIDRHKLIVTTPYGQADLPSGTNWFDYGSSNQVTVTNSPVVIGGTQYVCRGWTRTGSVPASGTTTNTGMFVLTNDCSVVWLWGTNYWLHVDATGNGSVSTSDVWLANGTNIQVTATPDSYYVFGGWQGQTNGCTLASNKITVVMNTARSIGAVFIAETVTNAVPKWWLAQHGFTNFDADAMNDADLDGLKVWQEYIAGCDPTNRESFFRVTKCAQNVIGWNAVSGRVYSVYWATNLLSGFQCLESNIPWTRGSFTNPITIPCGYYRIDVRLE